MVLSTPTQNQDTQNLLPVEEAAQKTLLTAEEISELRELKELAGQARGSWYPEEVDEATRKFSALLAKHHEKGVPYSQLALATGMKWRSIKARLARHGFLAPPPSQEDKVFRGPLTKEDRYPTCGHDKSRWRERYKDGRLLRIECLDCRKKNG